MLFALLTQKQGIIAPLVEKIGGTANALAGLVAETQKLLDANPKMHCNVQIPLSPEAGKILANAEKEAAALKDEYLSAEHIFLAAAQSDGKVGALLKKSGITKAAILGALKDIRGNQRITSEDPEATMQSLENTAVT